MNLLNVIATGLREIWAHKFRSLLTMLGIIIGAGSRRFSSKASWNCPCTNATSRIA
jgi:hypothetical protein